MENTSVKAESKETKPNKTENKWRWTYSWFCEIFKNYPVTIISYVVASLFISIVIGFDLYRFDRESLYVKLSLFLAILSKGSVLAEELCRHRFLWYKKIPHLILIFIFAVISGIFALAVPFDKSSMGFLSSYWLRYLLCYLVSVSGLATYLMYRRCSAEKSSDKEVLFENYFASVWLRYIKASVIYGLIVFALSLILALIFYTVFHEFNAKLLAIIETIAGGFIFCPIVLYIKSSLKETLSKVLCFIVKYIMMPLLLIYFFAMYLCAIFAVFKHDFSYEPVLFWLEILFMSGLFIWTIAANFKEQIWGKIAVALPFVFTPLVIFQTVLTALAVMQAINDGIRASNYVNIITLAFEIIYLIIYSIKSRKYLQHTIFVVIGLCFISQIVPGINIHAVIAHANFKSLKKELPENKVSVSEVFMLSRICSDLDTPEGQKLIEKNFNPKEQEVLKKLGTGFGFSLPGDIADPFRETQKTMTLEELADYLQ